MDLAIPDVSDLDTLSAALAYAATGWYVGPLINGSKHPGSRLGNTWHARTSRDPETIVAWFAGSDDGLFLHCGRSGAVAFDVDDPAKLPDILRAAIDDHKPPHQSTRSDQPGRGHYVFTQPAGRNLGNGLGRLPAGWGEIRGRNGVIVVEPTRHENTTVGRYQWLHTGTVPPLPEVVAELLNDNTDATDAATDAEVRTFLNQHTTGDRLDMLDVWVALFANKVTEGASRHDSMVSICAGAMAEARAGYYPAKTALDRLEIVFTAAVAQPGHGQQGKPRSRAMALSEWRGIGAWAVAQANAADLDKVRDRATDKVPDPNWFQPPGPPPPPNVNPATGQVIRTLEECHQAYRRWLGDEYDLDALDAVLCAAACEQLDGDPLWLLVISGSGNAKTETVQALRGLGAEIVSTISSDAALLSGTPKHERSKKATGGLLRKIGARGVLVIKDVTSILSTDRNTRGTILSALREVHDGRWTRDVGTEGGLTLVWEGRIVVIGAVTTAWDQAHDVIATMGDRFVLVRMDTTESDSRVAARRNAIRNTGSEIAMRNELSAATTAILTGIDSTQDLAITEEESERIGAAADLVTLARTAVIFDYKGDVVDSHAPEMPTRFAKQLAQIIRGGVVLGMDRSRALRLAIRCARDSMPPLRLAIVDDVAGNPHSTPSEIRRRIDKPRTTVDRQCQALHMLGVLTVDEVAYGDQGRVRWHYSLVDHIDPEALNVPHICEREAPEPQKESTESTETPVPPFHKTGEPSGSTNGYNPSQADFWGQFAPGTIGAEVNP
jgi:hypothetical protein